MRYALLLTVLLSSSFMLFGQSTPLFITEHGGNVSSRSYWAINSDTLDNGNFVLLINQTSIDGLDEDISLVEVDRVSGEVTNRNVIALPGDQVALGVLKVPGGNVWVVAQSANLSPDNFADVLLLEVGANLELINSYTYDLTRYDDVKGIDLAGEGRISVIISGKNENFGDNNANLLTINTADGTEVSNVFLTEGGLFGETFYVQPGASGKVLVNRFNDFSTDFWGVDVITGEVDFSFTGLPDGTCPADAGAFSLRQNALYNESKNAYIIPTTCLSVLEVSMEGTVNIRSNSAATFGEFLTSNARVVITDEGFNVYEGTGFYTVTDNGNTYSTESFALYGFSTPAPVSPLSDQVYLTFFVGPDGLTTQVVDVENSTNSTALVPGLVEESIFTSNEHVVVDGDQIVTLEKVGPNYSALFYTLEGELVDSLSFAGLGYGIGIGLDGEGNLVAGLMVEFVPDNFRIIRFSREAGIIETVARFTVENPLGELRQNLQVGGPNSDFYVIFNVFDAILSRFAQQVMHINNNGDVLYQYDLPEEYQDFTFEPIAVDALGNVYLAKLNGERQITFSSIDPDGNLRYENVIENADRRIALIHSVEVNDAMNRVAIFVEDGNELINNFGTFIEMDAVTGAQIKEVAFSPDHTYTFSTEGIYQPGTNNVVIFNTYFRGDDVPVDESTALQFTVIDEEGEVVFQRDMITTYYGIPNVRDVAVDDNFNVYAAGRRFPNELNTSVSTLIGLNYDEVVSVEDAPNLDETAGLNVFPNPTKDLAQITWDNLQSNTYELTLHTLDGRLVSRWAGQIAAGRATLDVDMSRLPVGTYVARLVTPNGNSTQRIIKQ